MGRVKRLALLVTSVLLTSGSSTHSQFEDTSEGANAYMEFQGSYPCIMQSGLRPGFNARLKGWGTSKISASVLAGIDQFDCAFSNNIGSVTKTGAGCFVSILGLGSPNFPTASQGVNLHCVPNSSRAL